MIDRDTLTVEQREFLDACVAAGFPADDAALEADMQRLADAAFLPIANTNKYSAFWSFVRAAVREPARIIVRALVTRVIPGMYVKTAEGSMLDLIAWAHDLERKAAVKARGYLTFSRDPAVVGEVEIPAGTLARTIEINGSTYRMATVDAAVIPAGAESVSVLSEAVEAGAAYNLGAGYYSIVDSDVPRVGGVTNLADYLVVPGADEESDSELRLRIRDRFLAVGKWHTDAQYRSIIAGRAGISPDRIYFYRGDDYAPATVDAFIVFDAGVTPQAYLDDLNHYITTLGNHGHGDVLTCKAIPESVHDLTVTVAPIDSAGDAERQALVSNVRLAISCAFWGNSDYAAAITRTAPFSVFSFSRLAQELHDAFPTLRSVAFGSRDIVSALDLPKLGTLTVAIGDTSEDPE